MPETPRRPRGNPTALSRLAAQLDASRAADEAAREEWVEEYVNGADEDRTPSAAEQLARRLEAGKATARARARRAQAVGRRMNGSDTR